MRARVLCNTMERIDPSVGLAIITKDFVVRWANDAHLKRWPHLVRKVCYRHVNGFARPCKWCPVAQTFKDGRMHAGLVRSPSGDDTVLSNILSVPIFDSSGQLHEVVELVFDVTRREKQHFKAAAARYHGIFSAGAALERLASENHVPDFLLLGALWQGCLDFDLAQVYVIGNAGDRAHPRVAEIRTLRKDYSFRTLASAFRTSFNQDTLTSFRGRLKQLIDTVTFPARDQPRLARKLPKAGRILRRRQLPFAPARWSVVRVSRSSSLAGILSPGKGLGYALLVAREGTGHDLMTDDDLLDIGAYASFAGHALQNRRLAIDTKTVVSKAEQFLESVERDAGALVFAASVVSSFAHDLLASASILRSHMSLVWSALSPQHKEHLSHSHEAIVRETDFISGCMKRAVEIAKLEKATAENFRKADIHDLIRDAGQDFARVFHSRRIHFTTALTAPEPDLVCDPLLIRQLLSNLIDNSCTALQKATHRRRQIRVHTTRTERLFTIIVEDNGLGINPAIEEQIWQPFFSTKGKAVGTGLGLMICRRIVQEIHGGSIRARSKYGYSTRMVVTLPIRSIAQIRKEFTDA